MSVPSNFLQQVQTYQMAHLGLLLNYGCFVHESNKKFKDFNKMTGNLGDTVTFDLPPRFSKTHSLVAQFQSSAQRVQTLSCDNPVSVSYAYTSQQMIFNVEHYMEVFGESAVAELAVEVEADVATLCETAPYRFYGDGVTAISSFGQLADMMAQYRTYGYAHERTKAFLSDLAVPSIVNSGLNQFVMNRNEDMAQSWMVGNFERTDWFRSNLLPIHISGSVGNATGGGNVLTVLSTNDPTGNNITQITLSGAPTSDPDAILQYDSCQFLDNVADQPNLRYLTFVGHKPSGARVQLQVTQSAASDNTGHVTIDIFPPLCATPGNANQNLTYNIVAGMQLQFYPSHRCGMVVGGNSMYLAMPQLPLMPPYDTSNHMDEETGVSTRLQFGSVFGQNQLGMIHDCIWGKTAPSEYVMKIMFPLTQ